jgi:hypothetical protein
MQRRQTVESSDNVFTLLSSQYNISTGVEKSGNKCIFLTHFRVTVLRESNELRENMETIVEAHGIT